MPKVIKRNEDIFKLVQQDTSFNATPDLPLLRYSGEFKAFMWDEMKDTVVFASKTGLRRGNDFEVVEHNARTVQKYLPFKSRGATTEPRYSLPLTPNWHNMMADGELDDDFDLTARPITGKTFSLSLRAVQALDEYYCNGVLGQRLNIRIKSGWSGNVKEETMVTWYQPMTRLTKYDPHEQTYSLPAKLVPANMTHIMEFGEQHYCHQVYEYSSRRAS